MDIFCLGMGAVSPIGNCVEEFRKSLQQCKTGVDRLVGYNSKFDIFGAEIKGSFRENRFAAIAVQALEEALEDSGICISQIKNSRNVGLVFGTSLGNTLKKENYIKETVYGSGEDFNSSFAGGLLGETASYLCRLYNLHGPAYTVTNTCVSGINAIALGCQLITSGQVDICLVGGADILGQFIISGMSSLKALSRNNELKPLGAERDGIILGESAGFLVLAGGRNTAKACYGAFTGYAVTNDAKHLTSPDRDAAGMSLAITNSLTMGNLRAGDIDCIFCCGTGTKYNDSSQAVAINNVFGSNFGKQHVTSIKPYIGHTLGASGIVESIGAIVMMEDGYIAPLGLEYTVDPEWEKIPLLFQPVKTNLMKAILLSSGFTGVNGALIIERRIRENAGNS